MRHGVSEDGANITDASKEAIKDTFSKVPLPNGHKYEILYLFSTGNPEGNGRYTQTRDAVHDGVYEASKAQGFNSDIVLTKIEVTDLSSFTESELQSIWNKVSTLESKTYRIFIFGSFLLHDFTDKDVDKKYFAKSDDFMRLWYATKDLYNCNHDSNGDERGFMYNFAYLYRYTLDNLECVGDHHINNKPKTSSQSCEAFKNTYNDAKTCRKARKLRANWDDKFCLDVAGGNEDLHSENIQLWECNEVSETWYLDESNKIMAGWNSNVCLNVVGNKPEANASNVLTAVDCDTNTDDYKERWWLGDDGKIRAWWDTSLCLDIAGTSAEKREANAQIWQCDEVTETW